MTNLRLFYISVLVLYELTVSFTTLTVSARSSVISFLIYIHWRKFKIRKNQLLTRILARLTLKYAKFCYLFHFIQI